MSLIARNISLHIGRKAILDDVSFTAAPGELTSIVGHNGSGKTTLLRVMTGESTASGDVTLNGRPVTAANAPQLATMRGVLPQATQLAFPFKVIEVVRIGLQAGPHAADPHLAQKALDAVDLPHFAHRYYQELSGGEQQRVQLARVLAQVWQPVLQAQPCWLLLDEPVASLDIAHQLGIMDLARDYARRGGGVVAVMHDLNLTAMYSDSVAILREGRLLVQGTPAEVLTSAILSRAYGYPLRSSTPPAGPVPYLLPQAAGME